MNLYSCQSTLILFGPLMENMDIGSSESLMPHERSNSEVSFSRLVGYSLTGDVLPCFDAPTMVLPEDTSCIITVPFTLHTASNHGVIVASKIGILNKTSYVSLVKNLLQKPTMEELVKNQAILDDVRTLLGTGITAFRGKAWAKASDGTQIPLSIVY